MDKPVNTEILKKLLIIIPLSLATVTFGAGDPIAGKALAGICTDCHAEDGNSEIALYPKLAGQLEGYIVKRTTDLSLRHGGEDIPGEMLNLQSGDLQSIAAYYASQVVMKGESKNTELMKEGQSLYNKERCYFCHPEGGRPTEKTIYAPPVIGGQHKDYLIKSMKLIQSGERQADVYDLMHQTLVGLSGDDLSALAEFLSGS